MRSSQVFLVLPVVLVVTLMNMIKQHIATMLTIAVFILHLLFYIDRIIRGNIPLQVARQLLNSYLQIRLVILEYNRVIILFQIERERIRVHQSLAAEAEHVDGLAQELHLDPGHVVLLHLLHLVLHHSVEL